MTTIITDPIKDIWFISDTHFRHSNFLSFVDENGNKVRPFNTVQEMDDCMTTNWNAVVKPYDRIYHLGDVGSDSVWNNQNLSKLNGSKRLILGNHDIVKGDLVFHFKKITMWRIFKEHDFVCSHMPLREDSMFKITFNLHGHIHQAPAPTIRHMNMCVEHTNYAPVHLDTILAELAKRRKYIETEQLKFEMK
jgi:calcineurin-like phosphoesterase family protein